MEFEHRVAEPCRHKSAVNHIERSRLLGYEEHGFRLTQAVRDDVRDGLALSGTRRPDEDEVTTFRSCQDSCELRAVRGQWRQEVPRQAPTVDLLRFNESVAFRPPIRLLGPVDEMLHEPVLPKLIGAVDQVFPHEVLRERKGREREFLDNFEAGDITHLPAHDLEYERDVDSAFVSRELTLELRDAEVEVTFQKLE